MLDYPEEGSMLADDVNIDALIKTAPGISVRDIRWSVDGESHYEGEMNDIGGGIWRGVWETRGPNGNYRVNVQAVGFQEDVQGAEFPVNDWVEVEVDNPPFTVNAWCWNNSDSKWYQFSVPIYWWGHGEEKQDMTPFYVERCRDQGIKVEGQVEIDGQPANFIDWAFSDTGDPNDGIEWWGAGEQIEIDEWILEQVYHRELLCLYNKS